MKRAVLIEHNTTTQRREYNAPNGYFAKGNPGRPKGVATKALNDIRKLILEAADEVGEDGAGKDGAKGYLKMLATEHPPVFAQLLVKTMPNRMEAVVESNTHVTFTSVAEVEAEIQRRGLPPMQLLESPPELPDRGAMN